MFSSFTKTAFLCAFVSFVAYAAYSLPNMKETDFQQWASTNSYLKDIAKKNIALCSDGSQGKPYAKELEINGSQVSFTAHVSCPDMTISREILKISGANVGTSRRDDELYSIVLNVLGEDTANDFRDSRAVDAKVLKNSKGVPTSVNLYQGENFTYVITSNKISTTKYVEVYGLDKLPKIVHSLKEGTYTVN